MTFGGAPHRDSYQRGFNMNLKEAHKYCSNNRLSIQQSEVCGCFYCLAVFESAEVTKWVRERSGAETVLCPRCGIDSVLGSVSGLRFTAHFLELMRAQWFERTISIDDISERPEPRYLATYQWSMQGHEWHASMDDEPCVQGWGKTLVEARAKLLAKLTEELELEEPIDERLVEDDVSFVPFEPLPESPERLVALFAQDPDDASYWLVRAKDVDGCHTFGRSLPHAREMIRDALRCFFNGVEFAVIVERLVSWEEWESEL